MVRRGGCCIGLVVLLLAWLAGGLTDVAEVHAAPFAGCGVVLVPGAFSDSGKQEGATLFIRASEYFADYREFFAKRGCVVKTAVFPPDGTIEERGMMLRDQVDRFRAEAKLESVDLVAHSQGGLDARYALKSLGLHGVRTVVSIGTPHRGTPLADWVVRQRERETLTYWILRIGAGYDLQTLRFAGEFQPVFIGRVAGRLSEASGVRYASASGLCRSECRWYLRALDWWVGIPAGDGISPAESQRFGQDLGVYDLDHLSEVGTDPGKRAERLRLLESMWGFISENR